MSRDPRAAPANNLAGVIGFDIVDSIYGPMVKVTADAVFGAPYTIGWLSPDLARQHNQRLSDICTQLAERTA
ncbi:hypothetical protein [Dongia sp.]|uniref:hypothetical protein n=1 Tax=Dongia sp. TaxID=1977262 RepID=UPI0035B010A8